MPIVSILIPTYKRASFLREAIASALAQTYHDVEVLVLDDASPDETPSVVAEFAGDTRLRSIRHPGNLGIAENWRAGIEAKQGDFFCILHDDDTFEPEFVQTLIQPLLGDPDAILTCSDHWMMDSAGNRLASVSDECSRRFRRDGMRNGKLPDFARSALVDASPPIGATLFRSSMIRPEFIHEKAKGSIDAWLFYECVRTGRSAYYCSQRLMNYRIHAGGMSSSMPLYMTEGHIFRYRRILADPERASLHVEIVGKLAEALTVYSVNLLVQGRCGEARQSAREALTLRFSRRAQVIHLLTYAGEVGTRTAQMIKWGSRVCSTVLSAFNKPTHQEI